MHGRKLFSFFAVAFLGLSLVAMPTVAAASTATILRAALQAGGDRLEDLQNPDGGWFFTVGDTDCGAGAGVSCQNTFGVTGLGLISAYWATRDPDFKAAAVETGDALVARYAAAPACDFNPATSVDRPVTVDTEFLLELTRLVPTSQGKVYRTAALKRLGCIMTDLPTGTLRADERLDRRIGQGLSNLGEWDAALDIEAFIDAGQRTYALQMALRVIGRQAEWNVADPQCPSCEILGKGLLIDVLQPLGTNATIKAAIAAWTAELLAAQKPNGSWADDTQTTAYVLMGLDNARRTAPVKAAINSGLHYLLSQRIGNGGYDVGTGSADEITEVDSEVLQALFDTLN